MTTIFLGIISILQGLFLPGFLISTIIKKIDIRDRLIIAIPLSIVFNYILVIFLIICNLYNKETLLSIIFCECLFLGIFNKNILYIHDHSHTKINLNNYIAIILLSLVAYSFISEITQFFNSIGTVFTDWDAIVSYNRWAKEWAANVIPGKTVAYPYGTYSYPQAIPIIYSISYVLTGSGFLEQFPKIIITIFPLATLGIFARLLSFLKNKGLAIAWSIVIFFVIFQNQFYKNLGYTGYIEPVVMFYGLFIIYSAILFDELKKIGNINTNIYIIIACIAVSGVALVKQHGILAAYGFPVLFFLYSNKNDKSYFNVFILIILLISLIIIPWYIYKLSDFIAGNDSIMLSFYTDFNGINNINFYERPIVGMRILFEKNYAYFLLIPLIASLRNSDARRVALYLVLPYYLIWSLFLIYNVQNISIILPAIAILIGYGMQEISKLKIGKYFAIIILFIIIFYYIENYFILIISSILLIIFIVVNNKVNLFSLKKYHFNPLCHISLGLLLLVGVLIFKGVDLTESALAQNFKIGNVSLNQKLKKFTELHDGKVATSYQMMGFILPLSERFLLVQCSTKNQFLSGFALPNVSYHLVADWCHEDVKAFMKKAFKLNQAEILFNVDGFVMYSVVDDGLKLLLSKTGRIARDDNLHEHLFFPNSPPFEIKAISRGSIGKIEFTRNNFMLSGQLPQYIDQHRVDWVVATIGGNMVALTETLIKGGENSNSMGELDLNRMANFSLEIPLSLMKNTNGSIRLFAVAKNKLYELNYEGNDFTEKRQGLKINIIASGKKLFLMNDAVDPRQLNL